MIVDKIITYLKSRSDIKYEEDIIFLDRGNIAALVERHPIKVFAPINKNTMLPLHYVHQMEEFVSKFYLDLKNNTGIENLKLLGPNNGNKTIEFPKIVYKNDTTQTDIFVKYNGETLTEKGVYNKELDIEFF